MLFKHNNINKFEVVDIDKFIQYEETDDQKVEQIVNDMSNKEILKSPVIYDKKLSLLIDGHHRLKAIKRLGAKNIAVFNVNYFSDDVTIQNWYRIIYNMKTQDISELSYMITKKQQRSVLSEADTKKSIIISSNEKNLFEHSFLNEEEINNFLNIFCKEVTIKKKGLIRLSSNKKLSCKGSTERAILTIKPPVDKSAVLKMARSDRLFQYQINRHLIKDRPLQINLPIEILHLDIRKATKLYQNIILNKQFVSSKNIWHDNRFYEEKVMLFYE